MTLPAPDPVQIKALVQAGLLAPSGDNCQPWRFVWDGARLEIHWLAERAESFYDVDRTASWIALGALLTNMRIAAGQEALQLHVELFPTPHHTCVARLAIHPSDTRVDHPLFAAIPARCVNRRPYTAQLLTATVRDTFFDIACMTRHAALELITEPDRKAQLAALAAHNDRWLFEHRALHDGLYRWLRWTIEDALRTGDGMPIHSLELSWLERPGFRWLTSWRLSSFFATLGVTRLLPLRSQWVYRRSAAIGLLSVDGDRPEDFVRAGEILEELWLTATKHGVAFQPITGITFLVLRRRLTRDAGLSPQQQTLLNGIDERLAQLLPVTRHKTPAMLFRVGYARQPSARAPRLPVDDVLTMRN